MWKLRAQLNLPMFTQLARVVDSVQSFQFDLSACPLLHCLTLSPLCVVFMILTFISHFIPIRIAFGSKKQKA